MNSNAGSCSLLLFPLKKKSSFSKPEEHMCRQLPQSLLMSLMPFPCSQLAICALVLGLSQPAVLPYISVTSATKVHLTLGWKTYSNAWHMA